MPDHGFKADSKAAFMCECGASLCDERVWMTGADYDLDFGPVVSAGHGPDRRSPTKCFVCGRPGRVRRRKLR